ncbi:unnamed protein product [Candida parapsilosis]
MFRLTARSATRSLRLPVQKASFITPLRFYVAHQSQDEVINQSSSKGLGLIHWTSLRHCCVRRGVDLEIPDKIADDIKTVGEALTIF